MNTSDWEQLNSWIQLLDQPFKGFLLEVSVSNVDSILDLKKIIEQHSLTSKDIDCLNSILNMFYVRIKSTISELNLSFLTKLSNTNKGYVYFLDKLKSELEQEGIMYPEYYLYQNKIQSIEVAISDKFHTEMFAEMNLDLVKHFVHKEILRVLYYLSVKQVTATDKLDSFHVLDNLMKVIDLYQIESNEIEILLQVLHLILSPNLSDFDALLIKLTDVKLQLEMNDISTVYSILVNTLFHNIKVWERTELDLLAIYISKYQNYKAVFYGTMTPSQIKNMATLCIRLNKIDWFQEVFMQKETLNLSSSNQDALTLCEAKFLFHDTKYNESIAILNQFKTSDIFQELELRRLQVMCFYELHERVLVDNYLNTFKVFIHRNDTINEIFKESNNNFVRLLNRINTCIHLKKTEAILEDYNKMNRIAEKHWLNEKIINLKEKLIQEKS